MGKYMTPWTEMCFPHTFSSFGQDKHRAINDITNASKTRNEIDLHYRENRI